MKRYRFALPVIAILMAFAASAFTMAQNNQSDLVWFELDPDTGDAIQPNGGGTQSASDPFSCDPNEEAPCSVALSLDDGEVIENNGVFSIAQSVDYKDPGVYEAMHFVDRP